MSLLPQLQVGAPAGLGAILLAPVLLSNNIGADARALSEAGIIAGAAIGTALVLTRQSRFRFSALLALAGTALAIFAVPLMVSPKGGDWWDGIASAARAEVVDQIGIGLSANALGYLMLPAPLACAAFAFSTDLKRSTRMAWALAASVGALVLAITGSRGSLLGLLAGLGLLAALGVRATPRRQLLFCLVAFAIPAGALIVLGGESLRFRIEIWRAAGLSLGGNDSFGAFAARQVGPGAVVIEGDRPLNLHSVYVQTLSDFGLIGLLALLIMWGWALVQAWRVAVSPKMSTADRSLARASFAILCVMALEGVGESILSTSMSVRGHALTVVSPVLLLLFGVPVRMRPSGRDDIASPFPEVR